MAKINPELRQWLMDAGHWTAFLARREELRALKIDPRDIAYVLDKEFGEGRQNKPYVPTDGLKREVASQPGQPSTKSPLTDKFADPSIWAGRPDVDPRTAIAWVFNHLYAANVAPDQAPSIGAWGMLIECRESSKFRQTFLDTIWIKTLPRDLDPEADRWTDKCEKANSVIDKVLAASQKAQGIAGV
jgi:hypothetical protein